MRYKNRAPNELRSLSFARHFTKHAEGSVLVAFGETKVLCTVSLTQGVPNFLKGQESGWLTAEYAMLPRATHSRTNREATRGKQTGRTVEISRLIGRSLRSAVDLKALGENTLTVDCDVLQADGGTRTASITGASVALVDAIDYMRQKNIIKKNPLQHLVAAVSVGLKESTALLDLDYAEDSTADTDMNVIMAENGGFIEVQGTAEGRTFTREELDNLLDLARQGGHDIVKAQKAALGIV